VADPQCLRRLFEVFSARGFAAIGEGEDAALDASAPLKASAPPGAGS